MLHSVARLAAVHGVESNLNDHFTLRTQQVKKNLFLQIGGSLWQMIASGIPVESFITSFERGERGKMVRGIMRGITALGLGKLQFTRNKAKELLSCC